MSTGGFLPQPWAAARPTSDRPMTATNPCEGCNAGVLVGFTYDVVDLPTDVGPAQRCDGCRRFLSDEEAAIALARPWGARWGLASNPNSPDTPSE